MLIRVLVFVSFFSTCLPCRTAEPVAGSERAPAKGTVKILVNPPEQECGPGITV